MIEVEIGDIVMIPVRVVGKNQRLDSNDGLGYQTTTSTELELEVVDYRECLPHFTVSDSVVHNLINAAEKHMSKRVDGSRGE